MKKSFLLLGMFAILASTSFANKLPFADDFEAGIKADWEADTIAIGNGFGASGTLSAVTTDTDCRGTVISPVDVSSTTFAKLAYLNESGGSCLRVVGDGDEVDYIIETDIYVPVVDISGADADYYQDYWYQAVMFNTQEGYYHQLHFQYNIGADHGGRIRIREGVTVYLSANAADLPAGLAIDEGWKHVKMVIENSATQMEVFIDDVDLFGGPQAVTNTTFTAGGTFGVGQYVDGIPSGDTAVDVTTYIDNFDVYTIASTKLSADSWNLYDEALTE